MTLATLLSGLTSCGSSPRVLKAQAGVLSAMALSPRGRYLAVASGDAIEVWDLAEGAPPRRLAGHAGQVNALAFSADDRHLLSGGHDKTVRAWDVQAGSLLATLAEPEPVLQLATLPDNRRVLSVPERPSQDPVPRVHLWDVPTSRLEREHLGEKHQMFVIAVSADGRTLALGLGKPEVQVLALPEWRLVRTVSISGEKAHHIQCLALSTDGGRLAVGTSDARVEAWDLTAGRALWSSRVHLSPLLEGRPVTAVVFSPSGRLLASAGRDETVRLWRVRDGQLVRSLAEHSRLRRMLAPPALKKPMGAAFTPDEKVLLVAYQDGRVVSWPVPASE